MLPGEDEEDERIGDETHRLTLSGKLYYWREIQRSGVYRVCKCECTKWYSCSDLHKEIRVSGASREGL
jgi:hypothetical protein